MPGNYGRSARIPECYSQGRRPPARTWRPRPRLARSPSAHRSRTPWLERSETPPRYRRPSPSAPPSWPPWSKRSGERQRTPSFPSFFLLVRHCRKTVEVGQQKRNGTKVYRQLAAFAPAPIKTEVAPLLPGRAAISTPRVPGRRARHTARVVTHAGAARALKRHGGPPWLDERRGRVVQQRWPLSLEETDGKRKGRAGKRHGGPVDSRSGFEASAHGVLVVRRLLADESHSAGGAAAGEQLEVRVAHPAVHLCQLPLPRDGRAGGRPRLQLRSHHGRAAAGCGLRLHLHLRCRDGV